jgi:preprotein translocase subunit YajC
MRAAGLILPLIFFALFWVFYVLPQQRRIQTHRRYIASLDVGDEVITTAGVYGTVTGIEDDIVDLEIARGVEIRIARLAIGRSAVEPVAPEPPVVAEINQAEADDTAAPTAADLD